MSTERPPDILLVLSDQHRGQAMAHAGDVNLRTPVFDRLAREGVSLGRAYANCPVCTPSRGSIFSGRHAHAGPVAGFFDVYSATAPSLATEFKAAGYRTAYFGKWHCGIVHDQIPIGVRQHPEKFPGGSRHRTPEWHRAGFEDWCAFESLNRHFDVSVYRGHEQESERIEGYETEILIDEAIRYLEKRTSDQPVFLVVSITPPHFPLDVPEAWRRHDPQALEVRPNFIDKPDPPGAANVPNPWRKDPAPWAPESMRQSLADYYAMIECLDFHTGRLLDYVEARPGYRADETVFGYLSDHGDFLGSHGICEHKVHPHEESVRVPLILHAPGRIPPQGFRCDGCVGLVDLAPTVLGLAGLAAPVWMQGTDCAPALIGTAGGSLPEVQLLEMHNPPRWNLDHIEFRGYVDARWKYAYYETGRELLFDLDADPFEMNNLAEADPAVCAPHRSRLLELLRQSREPFFDVLIEHGVPCEPTANVSGLNYRMLGAPVPHEWPKNS